MPDRPWEDWIPGVLSRGQVEVLLNSGYINGADKNSIDESSIDLTLSSQGYELLQGAIKPFGPRYETVVIQDADLCRQIQPSDEGVFTLERKRTYVFKLNERFEGIDDARLHGQATAKSSVGRVDVLARLIVDGMNCYEGFNPKGLQIGSRILYLEVTPLTFNVQVKVGCSLSQLRLFYGDPKSSQFDANEILDTLLHGRESDELEPYLSLDLTPVSVSKARVASAFCAQDAQVPSDPIRLWKTDDAPKPHQYWSLLKSEGDKLRIEKESFYILRSKESLGLPKGIAAYCRATDETIGEMRIHYAGFVHPWFGRNRQDGKVGTPLIFEVRGHDVDVVLRQGEIMARLLFYRMSEDCAQPQPTEYDEQTLKLSKFFGEWES